MIITRYNKSFAYLKETNNLTKNEMKIKEQKENESSKMGNQNFEDLRYESTLCKEIRFKPFCG